MKSIVILLLQFFVLNSHAQYHWDKLLQIDGDFPANELTGLSLEIDRNGNKYLLSQFINQVSVDTFNLTTNTKSTFLLKTNSNDSILFFKKIAESPLGLGNRMRTDNSNNLILPIGFYDSLLFNNMVIYGTGIMSFILIKFDEFQNVIFIKQFYNNNKVAISDIQTDKYNNIYLLGRVSDSVGSYIVFDNDTIINQFADQIFVTKLDSNGTHQFTKTVRSSNINSSSLYIDSADNMYIAGSSYGLQLIFDTTVYTPQNPINFSGSHAFFAKFSSNGTFKWARTVGMSIYPSSVDIHKVICNHDNIFITGSTFSNITASVFFEEGGNYSNSSGKNYFMACYDKQGNYRWKNGSKCEGSETITQALNDHKGHLFVSGAFSAPIIFPYDTLFNISLNDVLFAQYDSLGNYLQSISAGGQYSESSQGMVLDQTGAIYLAGGTTSNPCTFGGMDINPTYNCSIFLAKLSQTPASTPDIEQLNFKIYPNPAIDKIFIESNSGEEIKIDLFNIFYQKIYSSTNKRSISTIDCSSFNSGLYFLKITEKNKMYQQKIIIQH